MLFYILGVITGVLVMGFLKKNEEIITGYVNQNSKIPKIPVKGAEFFDPMDNETEALEQVIDENNEKGVSTKLSDL